MLPLVSAETTTEEKDSVEKEIDEEPRMGKFEEKEKKRGV